MEVITVLEVKGAEKNKKQIKYYCILNTLL